MIRIINENYPFILDERISENDYSNSVKGKAYKVFELENGKLYPTKINNLDKIDTPMGNWLDADEFDVIILDGEKRVIRRDANRDRVLKRVMNLVNLDPEEQKREIKRLRKSTLAYGPGFHLVEKPRLTQFDRKFSWEYIEPVDDSYIDRRIRDYKTFLSQYVDKSNVRIGDICYISDTDEYLEIVDDNRPYLPYNFVWAECEYVMDVDYSDKQRSGVPTKGYYKQTTVVPGHDSKLPSIVAGSIRVNRLLDDFEVAKILGGNAPERQGGNKTLAELGLA